MLCVLRVSSLAVQGVPPRVVVIQRSECHTALTSLRQRDRLFFTPLLVLSDLSLFLCPFFSLPPSLSLSLFFVSLSLSLFFFSLSLSLCARLLSQELTDIQLASGTSLGSSNSSCLTQGPQVSGPRQPH